MLYAKSIVNVPELHELLLVLLDHLDFCSVVDQLKLLHGFVCSLGVQAEVLPKALIDGVVEQVPPVLVQLLVVAGDIGQHDFLMAKLPEKSSIQITV